MASQQQKPVADKGVGVLVRDFFRVSTFQPPLR
jgi:hypothetical protein